MLLYEACLVLFPVLVTLDESLQHDDSLTVRELRRQASKLGVPVAAQGVKMVLDALTEITGADTAKEAESMTTGLLTSSQRVSL